jgi:riboflavin synthase
MFTGLIEETGVVISPPPRLKIRARFAGAIVRGDSIAVDGVCLTAKDVSSQTFSADVMPETLRRSTLEGLRTGSPVNLERALTVGDTLGGHLVTGHVDGTGSIRSIQPEGNALVYTISCAQTILVLLAEKGSVAIDGISLTILAVSSKCFSVSVIPYTRTTTTLKNRNPGDTVNIECDPLARYAMNGMAKNTSRGNSNDTFLTTLKNHGFTGAGNENNC